MNNQPYNQQPQQQYQQQNYQAPMPPMQPQPPKTPFFNNDMLGIIACTASVIGFGLALFVVGAASLATPVYALILNILAFVLSGGGCFLSFVMGNQRIKSGAPRGTVATLGMIFGLAGFVLCLFAIFVTGCTTCAYCQTKSALSSLASGW